MRNNLTPSRTGRGTGYENRSRRGAPLGFDGRDGWRGWDTVRAEMASGRVAAEQITPYPPGIPAVVPGERLNDAVIHYLRSGLEAGMNVPDAADPSLASFRVVT